MITQLNVHANIPGHGGLTQREVRVATIVENMMSKCELIALQECGAPFLAYLESKLPAGWKLMRSVENQQQTNQEAILYNTSWLTCLKDETVPSVYSSKPKRSLQAIRFSHEGGELRVFNAHIPGEGLSAEEFARHVRKQQQPGITMVALGDNNVERERMLQAYQKAGFADFKLYSPWHTNINTAKESKSIDHIFVDKSEDSRILEPNEILDKGYNFLEMIALLNLPAPTQD